MKAFEKSCYLLPWPEVSEILTDEVEKHLGRHVPCWAKYEDESFWCADQPVLPLHEACQIMQLSGFPAENWQGTLPDEGGNTVNGFGMELSEHLLHKGLGLAWMRQIIAPEGLWLVGVYVKMEHHPEPVPINGMEVRFENLKSKDELFNFLNEVGCTHAALMEFCEDYKVRYGNDLCWPYPIAGNSCLGEYLVLVREGVLSLPYTGYSDNGNAVFDLAAAGLLQTKQVMQLAADWQIFSKDLLGALCDMGAYLAKQEGDRHKTAIGKTIGTTPKFQ